MLKNNNTESIPVRYQGETTTLSIPNSVFVRLDEYLDSEESEYTAKSWLAERGAEAIKLGVESPSAYAREMALLNLIPQDYTEGYKLDLEYSKLVVETNVEHGKKSMRINIFSSLYYALVKKFGSVDALVEAHKEQSDLIASQKTGKKDFSARYRAVLLDGLLLA